MSEVEFDRILDVVSMAIAPGWDDDLMRQSGRAKPPKAGNDNQGKFRRKPTGL